MLSKNSGFMLFEVLLSMGIFTITVIGIIIAMNRISETLSEIKISSFMRHQLENRLAYSLVVPPDIHHTRTIIGFVGNDKFTIQEKLLPIMIPSKNVTSLKKLYISIAFKKSTDQAEVILYSKQ